MNDLIKKMGEYEAVFGDVFPSFAFMTMPEEQVIAIIDECIACKKDVYERGILTLDEDIKY